MEKKIKSIAGKAVLANWELSDSFIEIENGVIKKIIPIKEDNSLKTKAELYFDDNFIIAPGFIDLQINGGFGKEFKTDIDSIETVSNKIIKYGVTSIVPTITTLPFKDYPKHIDLLSKNVSKAQGSRILGFHLEGPFLNKDKVGAQNSSLIKEPHEVEISEYLSSNNILMVTLAPELNGAGEFIKKLDKLDILIGIGHSEADDDLADTILRSYKSWVVHLFNAMNPLSSRSPGIIGAALSNKNYPCGLIVDGLHVSPRNVKIVYELKKKADSLILVTDGSALVGMPDGKYKIGDRTLYKDGGKVFLKTGVLAGSALTLDQAVRNLTEYSGCSLIDAIKCASYNPAKLLGWDKKIGVIKEEAEADFVVLDKDGFVKTTTIAGIQKYQR